MRRKEKERRRMKPIKKEERKINERRRMKPIKAVVIERTIHGIIKISNAIKNDATNNERKNQ